MTITPEILAWVKTHTAQGYTVAQLLPNVAQSLGVAVDANLEAALNAALNPAPVAQPLATAEVGAELPSAELTGEVAQVGLPAGFDLMSVLQGRVAAEKSSSRAPNWEVAVEELRQRITFRDNQPPGKRDETVRWLRPFLHPNPLAIETLYGTQPDGAPKNCFVVPAQHEEATKDQLMQIALSGQWDNLLLDVAAQQKAKKEENDSKPAKAPVDTAASDAALAELSAAAPIAQAAVAAAPGVMPAAVPSAVPSAAGMPSLEGMPPL